MTLLARWGFEAYARSLPAVEIVHQWGDSSVAKVGGKMFAMLIPGPAGLCFKVSEMSFDMLTDGAGVGQAPYLAKGQWVSVAPETSLTDADMKAYIAAAHRIIAGRLTRKLRAELGLDGA